MIDASQLAGLVMELISILCQGTIAGLIVLVATNWLQRKKEKDLTCKNALLVWLELHEHLAIIQDILAHQTFPETVTPISFSTPTWQNSQLQLTALPIDDLKFIGAYYQSLPAVSHLINLYPGKDLNAATQPPLLQAKAMCMMTRHLLSSYWDLKNAEKHRQLFSHMRQQSEYLL